jgi:hypothetical protein
LKVLILTFGTRGDIEPYAALAARLAAEGHPSVLSAPAGYRSMVHDMGSRLHGPGFFLTDENLHWVPHAGGHFIAGNGAPVRFTHGGDGSAGDRRLDAVRLPIARSLDPLRRIA